MKAEDLTNEELADIIRAMCITAISPSRDEISYLQEAARRLENEEDDGK